MMATTLYEVLGLPASATGAEIKAAYRRLARTCHPDVVSFSKRGESANEFMKIHAAYSTLSNPDKRAVYDRDLCRLPRRFGSFSETSAAMGAASSMSSKSAYWGYGCRNWETDQCW
ncbi:chaperone protein dnaJ 11, chloroplastic-like [Diospyros lotus]|uniref:chaperone protein dnaJ 11, chloroplastic-like n=1 Tax=Diospyros lotus TaxID=55363 RepID=UPI0022550B63|nr:chaperone protein dnaJ 11, chloroplastic-like [Diospyros lotus]